MGINIAIDGPAGAGKSTIARAAATKLGFIYVDTGALYRSIGLYCLEKGIETTDETSVSDVLSDINVELRYIDNIQKVLLNGKDVSEDIRKPECSMAASNVSAIPNVRAFLLDLQQKMAKENMSISRLAKELDTSRTAVSRILDPENTSITLNTIEKVAKYLGKRIILSFA